MPDYKAMYLRLLGATDQALTLLLRARQECEELYETAVPELLLLPAPSEDDPWKERMDGTLPTKR